MHSCILSWADISWACGPGTIQSTLGIAPFFNHLSVLNLSDSFRPKSRWYSKSVTMKRAEQSTEVVDSFHWKLCLWTKLVHFSHIELLLGERCIDIPVVFKLFLQLTMPGQPATQYFPRNFLFAWLFLVSAMTITFEWMHVYNQWCHALNLTSWWDGTKTMH